MESVFHLGFCRSAPWASSVGFMSCGSVTAKAYGDFDMIPWITILFYSWLYWRRAFHQKLNVFSHHTAAKDALVLLCNHSNLTYRRQSVTVTESRCDNKQDTKLLEPFSLCLNTHMFAFELKGVYDVIRTATWAGILSKWKLFSRFCLTSHLSRRRLQPLS